jgi:methyl-accepting chemotaxis protein
MRHLTVYQRLAIIIAVLSIAFFAVSAMQILVLRNAVLEERRTMIHDMVDAAVKILARYDGEATAGKIEPDKARQMAFSAIGAMRWGEYSDYVGVYGTGSSDAGVTYVHTNPKYINVNRWDFKDSHGKLLIQDIVNTARAGGGHVEYFAPRSAGGAELRKMSYVGAFGSGDKLLAIQAGVYVDDIDAVVFQRSLWAAIAGLCGLVVAGLTAFWLGRGIVVPLARTCDVMDGLTKGNLASDVPFVDLNNEIGRMARSLQVFKDHLVETTRMRTEQEEMKLRAAEDRRAVLARIADEFERSIGGVIRGIGAAAVEEQGAATKEIAQSVQRASQGTHDVMQTIVGVREASGQVDAAATRVLNAAGQLTIQSEQLKSETGKFLGNIRAA